MTFTAHLASVTDMTRALCGEPFEAWQIQGPTAEPAPVTSDNVGICESCKRLARSL